METLSKDRFERACNFIEEKGRPLDLAMFRFHFEGGGKGPVIEALQAFRNADGGFGHALEPDLRSPVSSVIATTVAFQNLLEIEAEADNEPVREGVRFLVESFDEEKPGWINNPPETNESPRAPWWQWTETMARDDPWGNPDAEVCGILWAFQDLVDPMFLDRMTSLMLEKLAEAPAPLNPYVTLCFLRFASSAPEAVAEIVYQRARADAADILGPDWREDHFRPWWLAPAPGDPLADVLEAPISESLDGEIAAQAADGSWQPRWSWGDQFPKDWQVARAEWASELTLRTLRALRAWGRIEER